MAFRASYIPLLLSSLPIAGCGTVANLFMVPFPEGGKSPFGGVSHDVQCVKQAANGESSFGIHANSEPGQHPQVAPMLWYAADLPFSLVGDFVTWPYTASYSCINAPIPVPPVSKAPLPPLSQTMPGGQPQPQAMPGGQPQTSPGEPIPAPSKQLP